MRHCRLHLLLPMVGGLLMGCSDAPPPEQPNPLHQVIGASQIRNPKERDAALVEACRESAANSSTNALTMGIPQIGDVTLRDSIAIECATTLFDNGKTEDAATVAKLITDKTKRESLLSDFGEGT